MYLTHTLSLSNAVDVLNYGTLLTDFDRERLGISNGPGFNDGVKRKAPKNPDKIAMDPAQFPGLFMSYVLYSTDFSSSENVTFVFGYDLLLRQRNYHVNLLDINGMFAHLNTFFADDIGTKSLSFLKSKRRELKKLGLPTDMNEVVFHDSVDARLIEYIIADNDQTALLLKAKIPKKYVSKVVLMSEFDKSSEVRTSRPSYMNTKAVACRLYYTAYHRYTGIKNPFVEAGKDQTSLLSLLFSRESDGLRYLKDLCRNYGISEEMLSTYSSIASLEHALESFDVYRLAFLRRDRIKHKREQEF